MNFKIIVTFFMLFGQLVQTQNTKSPKLVIGIVIDQMRAEYLYRFQDNYSENGFKRLMREGFNVRNMHYNYMPTATGPGHASIYTGTTPADHGIVSNDWYSRAKHRKINCAEDESVFLVDGKSHVKEEFNSYSRSPRNLQSITITDELKLFSNHRSKVIGISLKDRGAIFPAGHLADYAFWYHTETGDFITSSYYAKDLPNWLKEFNDRHIADSLLNLTWQTLRPIRDYKNSGPDDATMEKLFVGKKDSEFPYHLKKLRKKNGDFALMPYLPFGNTLLTQMAKAAISGENMGTNRETDFLTISYSSTDYVGHAFGIRSKELEDTYVRLDRELSELLSFLDREVGKDDYLLFLTADHAASDHPVFLEASRLPGKFFDPAGIMENLNDALSEKFGKADYVAYLDKTQVYFNSTEIPRGSLLTASMAILKGMEGIAEVFVPSLHNSRNLGIDRFFRRSHNTQNSGDLLLHFMPGWMPRRIEGTTHGSAYNDDTHVPLLWYGRKIPQGSSTNPHTIDQIAPTLSFLLDIPLSSSSSDEPIEDLFE